MSATVIIGERATDRERFAAAELRRYLYLATGERAEISTEPGGRSDSPTFFLGTTESNPRLSALATEESFDIPTAHESYTIRTTGDSTAIAVIGGDPQGVVYGVYRLLEVGYGIRFYLGRDAVGPRRPFHLPDLNVAERPTVARRGLLPWHDFLCGPSGYSYEDFRRYLDQMLKMRMNTLVLHNYAGGYPGRDINEPFMSFEYRGVGYDGYLDTSVDNQRWGLATTTADTMAFRAGDLMPYDVMASDAARLTRDQPESRHNTFAKAKAMMRQIISYAKSRGIEIVLGTDFDLVPLALVEAGCDPLEAETLFARIDDVVNTYPTLSYLQLYYSESHQVTTEQAVEAYRLVRDYLGTVAPEVRLLTGSWFQEERFPGMHERLQDDVIFSSLMPHDMTVKPDWATMAAAGRRVWAVPWMEIDGGLSEPQLAVARMSERLPELRAAGVDGVIGILWREQAVEMNVAYLADDCWRPVGVARDPDQFYRDYARALYFPEDALPEDHFPHDSAGSSRVGRAAEALRQLEEAGIYGMLTTTNQFPLMPTPIGMTTPEFGTWFFSGSDQSAEIADRWRRAGAAFETLLSEVDDPLARHEIGYWAGMMRWLHWYWQAHARVPAAAAMADPEQAWESLARSGFAEAIEAYRTLVRDWTGLGGLVSAAGGRWFYADPPPDRDPVNEQFRVFENRIRASLTVQPPDLPRAHGTSTGAVLTWQDSDSVEPVDGYHVYRAPADGGEFTRVTSKPLFGQRFADTGDGRFRYRVSGVDSTGRESPLSLADTVSAGSDRSSTPGVIVMPPPSTWIVGQSYVVAATIDSDRETAELGAVLRYRRIGDTNWIEVQMRTNILGRGRTFYGQIPGSDMSPVGVEYFVEGFDRHGASTATAPIDAPRQVFSVLGIPPDEPEPAAPEGVRGVRTADGVTLEWRPSTSAVELYRIYRASGSDVPMNPSNYLTYVPARQAAFHDHTIVSTMDTDGPVSYAVVAVSLTGVSSVPAVTRID